MSITSTGITRPTLLTTQTAPTPQVIYILPQPVPNKQKHPPKPISPLIPATLGGILLGGVPIGRLALTSFISPSIWKNPYARGAMHFSVIRAALMTIIGALAGGTGAYLYNKIRRNK